MDFVTGLLPGAYQGYNNFVVVIDQLSRRARCIATNKEVDTQECALLFWKTIIN